MYSELVTVKFGVPVILLLPLFATTFGVRAGVHWLVSHGLSSARPWNSWGASAAAGMGAVFVCTGLTHFLEPKRSGFEAIVPEFIPNPSLAVTLSGVAELALAAGLLTPRTRRVTALASVAFLVAVFPANVIAAAGVDHPDAPNTPRLPRTLLQLVFIGFVAAPLFDRAAKRLSQR